MAETSKEVINKTEKITKKDLITKTDEELLNMIERAKGHTGKEFGDYMGADFSYSFLTNYLRTSRGYENGWYKADVTINNITKETIIMKQSDSPKIRQSYKISKNVADEWKRFNKNVIYKTVTIDEALKRFMRDVKSGKVEIIAKYDFNAD